MSEDIMDAVNYFQISTPTSTNAQNQGSREM
jgi:hypothetical protein